MKVVLVNRFFHPDHSATSQHFGDLAGHLAREGFEVVVITSRQRIDDARAKLAPVVEHQGVSVQRVWSTSLGRRNTGARALDYLSFALAARRRVRQICQPGDALIAGTDPPLLGALLLPAVEANGVRLFNWLHDLFPEVAQAMGMTGLGGRIGHWLRRYRNRALRAAEANIVLGERMEKRVLGESIEPKRITIIPNWSDGQLVEPRARVGHALRAQWGLDGCFVVGYSGNFGLVHEFETLICAMKLLRTREDIAFVFIGEGARRGALQDAIGHAGLERTQFHGYQPRAQLAESLTAADLHYITLRPALEGLVLPSKLYGIMAAGRPAASVGDKDGEVARILERDGCGRGFSVSDGEGLAQFIAFLADNMQTADAMGRAARQAFETRYAMANALGAWTTLLRP